MSWEIIIKINDYYPKLDKIPYHEYDCIISNNNNESLIPLKAIKNNKFISKLKIIDSDLIFSIKIVNHNNKLLICKGCLLIPFIKLLQLYKKKAIKYEQYLKFFFENNIINNIFLPSFTLKNIFLKFIIKINLINCNISYPNNILFNNINNIKKNNSKNNVKNSSALDSTYSFGSISNLKNQENKTIHKSIEKKVKSRNKINNIQITNNKFFYSYKPSSKNKSLYNKEHTKKYYINSSISPLKKLHKEYESNKINIKYKKYGSQSHCKTHNKNNDKKNQLLNYLSERKISKKTDMKYKNQKNSLKKNNSVKNKILNYFNPKIEFKKQREKPKKHKSKSLKTLISIGNMSNKKIIKKNRSENTSFNKKTNKTLNVAKVNKNNSNNKKTNKKDYNNCKIYENKIKTNECQMDIKEKFIQDINNQEEIRNNYITIFEYIFERNKELKQLLCKEINKLKDDYLLYREKLIIENKQIYALKNQNNIKDIKNFIHVKINSRINNILLNKLLKIPKKENNIINIILHKKISQNKEKSNNISINASKNIIQEKLKQQKQIHILLKLIRDLIKNYGNLSQLYENDKNKKILLKSLFLRYNIREKENQQKMGLLDIYNKMVNAIKIKNNKNKINKLKKEEFKVIKEENEFEEDNNDEE